MDPEAIPPEPKPVDIERLKNYLAGRITVIDLRPTERFVQGHIPGSINIPSNNPELVVRLMYLLHPGAPVLFLADDPGEAQEVAQMVHQTRRNPVVGWYEGTFEEWQAAGGQVEPFPTVDLATFRQALHDEEWVVVDVREPMEWTSTGVVPGSLLVPLREVHRHITELPERARIAVICAAGGRATIAASLLRAHGLDACAVFPGGVPHLPPDDREPPS